MQLHISILNLLKEKFPDLKLPEIQEGFNLSFSFSITPQVAWTKDQSVKWVYLNYNTAIGEIIYTPMIGGVSFGQGQSEKLTLEELERKIDWIKSTGTVTVHGSVTLIVEPVTV